jgi:hypothetical protein
MLMNTRGRACWYARSIDGAWRRSSRYSADVMVMKGVPEHILSYNGPRRRARCDNPVKIELLFCPKQR